MVPPFAVYDRKFYTSVTAMITNVVIIATMQILAANITFSYVFRCCLACLSNELVSISWRSPLASVDEARVSEYHAASPEAYMAEMPVQIN